MGTLLLSAVDLLAVDGRSDGGLLAVAASEADFRAARVQMALSLGWHIVVACFGVGMPALVLIAEWRG